MTVEELAHRHPCLYHLTLPSAWEGIERYGLLSTSALLDLFGVVGAQRGAIESQRRVQRMVITHPIHGQATITDNLPLSEKALANCLDDGLSATDWLKMLNQRVFLWPSEKRFSGLLNARANRFNEMMIIAFDTHALLSAHFNFVDLSPINSGSTIHRPARRGLGTFTRAHEISYKDWQRRRGRVDQIKEVTIFGSIPNAREFVTDIRHVAPRPSLSD